MNKRQLIALCIGGFLIITAVVMRPIDKPTTVKSNGSDFVTYRDIAQISPLWDWWITRHDTFSFSSFPYSVESADRKTKEDYDLNWRLYSIFIGLPTVGDSLCTFSTAPQTGIVTGMICLHRKPSNKAVQAIFRIPKCMQN